MQLRAPQSKGVFLILFAADKFWSDQDALYNYKADLHGIGNRSTIV